MAAIQGEIRDVYWEESRHKMRQKDVDVKKRSEMKAEDSGCRKKVNMGKEGERMSQKGTAQVRMCAAQIHCGEDEVVI